MHHIFLGIASHMTNLQCARLHQMLIVFMCSCSTIAFRSKKGTHSSEELYGISILGASNIELSCAAESPTRSEPEQRHPYEREYHLRRQLQRFVMWVQFLYCINARWYPTVTLTLCSDCDGQLLLLPLRLVSVSHPSIPVCPVLAFPRPWRTIS